MVTTWEDVLIDFLRGHPEAIQLLETSDHEFWISAVSVAELYVGVRDGKEREVLDQLIGLLRVVKITTEIAQQAGLWRGKYGRNHVCSPWNWASCYTSWYHEKIGCH